MKSININTGQGIQLTVFPDGQPHVNISGVEEGEDVSLTCSLTSSEKVLQLLMASDALDNLFARKKLLIIPYLLGARYDRLMLPGDSIDIKVIAKLINSCGFEKVILFDVHSDASTLLIDHAVNISNKKLVEKYSKENAVLICPDAGAAKKMAKYLEWNAHFTDIVYCSKNRNLATGKLTLEVLEPEQCAGRNCVIVDDICDGGGTFLAIAEQIKPAHLTLIVSHGIFSKGYTALEQKFNSILVSNSYGKKYESGLLQTFDVEKLLKP